MLPWHNALLLSKASLAQQMTSCEGSYGPFQVAQVQTTLSASAERVSGSACSALLQICGESNTLVFTEAAAAGVARAVFISVHDYNVPGEVPACPGPACFQHAIPMFASAVNCKITGRQFVSLLKASTAGPAEAVFHCQVPRP